MTRIVALGDSISCGEGVGIRVPTGQTWTGLLARSLAAELRLLAQAGARTRDVRAVQLPAALADPASLATVFTGLNDMVHGGFDAPSVRSDLLHIVRALRDAGVPVLVVRLHDPTAPMPVPRRLRRRLQARIDVINAAVDDSRGPGVEVLDLRAVAGLRARDSWALDRVHPSPSGHAAIAAAAASVLAGAGFEVAEQVVDPQWHYAHVRVEEMRWLARHGAPYLLRKAGEQRLSQWATPDRVAMADVAEHPT